MSMIRSAAEALAIAQTMGDEFALLDNPPGIFPPQELVPLAPRYTQLQGGPSAIFLDMDGTVTDTEPLFLHGVEMVVRRAMDGGTKEALFCLDKARDLPKIVGFSTVRNLEYLYTLQGQHMKRAPFFIAVDSSLRFLGAQELPEETETRIDSLMKSYGLSDWWVDGSFHQVPDADFRTTCEERFPQLDSAVFSQFGLMVFFADYLDALEKINSGEGAVVSRALFGDATRSAVAPMPGVSLLCALAKGWLSPDDAAMLCEAHSRPEEEAETLRALCKCFVAAPVPIALVTSSGSHETGLVLEAVFRSMRAEVDAWSLDRPTTQRILEGFAAPSSYFDTIVTCDDVIDGRTKPFRDPYTLALDRLGLHGPDAGRVIGFEDTEVGIIAHRGAGVGVPCALPIEHTLHQDFSAASHVLHGGLLDALFTHGLFIPS